MSIDLNGGNLYLYAEFSEKRKKSINAEKLAKNKISKESVVHIFIKDITIEEIPDLSQFPNLETLKLEGVLFDTLKISSNNSTIKEIVIRNNFKLKNIEDINKFPSLNTIRLLNCSSLTRLPESFRELKGLKKLSIVNSPIKTIDEIDECTNIEELSIEKTNINSLEALKNLKNLKKLSLKNNSINFNDSENFKIINTLKFLNFLYLPGNNIAKMYPLELPLLTRYILSNNNIHEINHLEHLPKLRALLLTNNKLINLKGISTGKNLDEINVSDNNLKDYDKELNLLKKLNTLVYENNNLSSLKDIDNDELKYLLVSGNNLYTLNNFKIPKNLTHIDIAQNKFKTLNLKKLMEHFESHEMEELIMDGNDDIVYIDYEFQKYIDEIRFPFSLKEMQKKYDDYKLYKKEVSEKWIKRKYENRNKLKNNIENKQIKNEHNNEIYYDLS